MNGDLIEDLKKGARALAKKGGNMVNPPPSRPVDETEAQYVARHRAQAQLEIDRGIAKDEPFEGKGRAERAAAYATWRYRAFLAGEVARL